MKILILDDEEIQRISISDDLTDAGYTTTAIESPTAALDLIGKELFDVLITDLKMPTMDGISLLEQVKKIQPALNVIMMTAYGTVESAVKAMQLGASDYLTKPFRIDELLLILDRIRNYRNVLAKNLQLKKQLETRYAFGKIIGKSPLMQEVYRQISIVAPTSSTVLLEGATGTGKEMAADAIHHNSGRKDGPLVKVSCATLSKEILESELFGHERGAFTTAVRQKKGRFELAHQGSIFLDEVDDIPLQMQVKLLRVLEERAFERVGGTEKLSVDVRVIAATKKNLHELVTQGQFREDLFYRLNIFPIKLPPLHKRKGDIPLLFEHFLQEFSQEEAPRAEPAVIDHLMNYLWPGNVRELRNVAERSALSCKTNFISADDLPQEILEAEDAVHNSEPPNETSALDQSVAEFEIKLIREALAKTSGNKARAAELLKVPSSTLKSKMKKLGIK